MKKLLLLKSLLLLCALIVGSSAWATSYTYKLTIVPTDFTTSSYADNNGIHYKDAICTTDGSKKYSVAWTSDQVYQKSSNIQFQKGNGYIYNNTDLGTISNITITKTTGVYNTYYGTTVHPTSGTTVGNGFFTIKENNSATGAVSSIEITFTAEEVTQVATPDFSIASGTYFETKNVTLSCATGGATIHYTIDGTDPTASSPTYSSPISVSSNTTIKAIAVKDGLTDSEIASETYTIILVSPNAKGINTNYYTKVTNINELEDGDAVLIVNEGKSCAMSTTESSSVRLATDVTISNNTINEPSASVQKITIVKVSDKYFFYTGSENGYLYAAGGTSNNYLKTTKTLNTDAIATISISSGDATITFQGSATRNLLRYNYNGGTNPRFTCYASGQQAVQIYKEIVPGPSVPTDNGDGTITLATSANMDGWRAFYDASQDYQIDASTTVYVVKAKAGTENTVNLVDAKVTKVKAGTPVILKTTAVDHKMILTNTTGAAAIDGNLLSVTNGSSNVDGYRLGYKSVPGVAFFKYTTTTAPAAGIVYIDKTNVNTGSGAREYLTFGFGDDNETTSINATLMNNEKVNKEYFNLAGQRVAEPTKGLYIVNGKKVVIK